MPQTASSQHPSWRHAAARIHLWMGLALALYLLVMSLTGSLIVLRPQFHRWLAQPEIVEWLVDLHDNLLGGRVGRIVNGVGGAFLTVLVVTGLMVWWTGRARWRNVIGTGRPAMSSVFARRLHVALGFWVCAWVLVWAVTAVYFGFPGLFDALQEFLDVDPGDDVRPGDQLLEVLVRLHFGRMGGLIGRFLWIVLGLLPAVLVVTGVIAWGSRRPGNRSEQ